VKLQAAFTLKKIELLEDLLFSEEFNLTTIKWRYHS